MNDTRAMMLTIERVIVLKEVIKWHAIFGEARLNASTMRSAMRYRRPLREAEAEALTEALARRGLLLADGALHDLRADAQGRVEAVDEKERTDVA